MRIDRIDLHHVAMPLIAPWRTAYGEDYEIHAVLCRMESGSLVGWGETSPLAAPTYSAEWAGGVFAVLRDGLAPRLLRAFAGSDLISVFGITAWPRSLSARRRSSPETERLRQLGKGS